MVIEALAAGKPVVCIDTAGPGMHVTEDCGIKITPTSPQATVQNLGDALEHLYLDECWRTELGEAGRERARNLYHWDRLGDRLMDIYRAVT